MIEDERNPADFFDAGFRLGPLVDEVRRYRDSQFTPELFPLEPFQRVPLPVGANQHVELVLRHRMIGGRGLRPPTDLWKNDS